MSKTRKKCNKPLNIASISAETTGITGLWLHLHKAIKLKLPFMSVQAHVIYGRFFMTWCKENNLKIKISKLNEPAMEYNASNIDDAAKKLQILNMDVSHTYSTW